MQGWSLLAWEDLVVDREEEEDDAEFDPNLPRRVWQQKASERVDTQFVATNDVWPIHKRVRCPRCLSLF